MPLLPAAVKKIPKETLSVRLDPELIERLDEYCSFIGNGRQDVIQNALTYIFDQDKEFHTWVQDQASKTSGSQ